MGWWTEGADWRGGGGGVRGSSIKISLKRKLGLVIMVLKVNIFLVL